MKKFCKLIEHPEHGQILVKYDQNDNQCPEVRTYFQMPDLGVIESAFTWPNTDESWDLSARYFEQLDDEQVIEIVAKVKEDMGDMSRLLKGDG